MRRLMAFVFGLALVGCADIPGITPTPPALPAPPPPPEEPQPLAEGSLWRGDASRRFLAFENRAKRIGDLVTVKVVEQAEAENEATTELDRTSSFKATLNSAVALQTLVSKPILTVLSLLGLTTQRNDPTPTSELEIVDAKTETEYGGEGTTERKATFTATVACIVTDVTDAGLLRIEGDRQLRINNETQIIQLAGFVRPEDILIDNTIPSTLVASADIQYRGVGVVSEKQRAPWLMRLFELVLPF